MHIHYINGITCKDMSLKDVLDLVSDAKKKASVSNVGNTVKPEDYRTTMSMICAKEVEVKKVEQKFVPKNKKLFIPEKAEERHLNNEEKKLKHQIEHEKEDSYNDSKENKQEEEIIESESVPPSRRFQTSFSTPPM